VVKNSRQLCAEEALLLRLSFPAETFKQIKNQLAGLPPPLTSCDCLS
jgi:hypothetical protein